MYRRSLNISLILITVYCLSACGYYLRGHAPTSALSLESFALESRDIYGPVSSEIVKIADNRKMTIKPVDEWGLAVQNVQIKQWKASTSRDYSQNQYWITVTMQVIVRHQQTQYQPIEFKQEALFQDNVDRLNSKSAEKQQILQELYRKLAQQALLRLSYLVNNPPDCDCEKDPSDQAVHED